MNPELHERDLLATVERVRALLEDGATDAGDRTLLPFETSQASITEVARVFGQRFTEQLPDLETGKWVGPVPSSFGLHFVRIDQKTPPSLPEMAAARAAVERDLNHARTRQAVENFYRSARARYRIRIEPPASSSAAVRGARAEASGPLREAKSGDAADQ